MSELKVHRFLGQDEVWPDANLGSAYYLKSEADNVIVELEDKARHYPMMAALIESGNKEIAELKKACNDKDDWCLHTLKELRHQKYKRCLAMASLCSSHRFAWSFIPEDDEVHKSDFYKKWYKRWLELAEKFKPNN